MQVTEISIVYIVSWVNKTTKELCKKPFTDFREAEDHAKSKVSGSHFPIHINMKKTKTAVSRIGTWNGPVIENPWFQDQGESNV